MSLISNPFYVVYWILFLCTFFVSNYLFFFCSLLCYPVCSIVVLSVLYLRCVVPINPLIKMVINVKHDISNQLPSSYPPCCLYIECIALPCRPTPLFKHCIDFYSLRKSRKTTSVKQLPASSILHVYCMYNILELILINRFLNINSFSSESGLVRG